MTRPENLLKYRPLQPLADNREAGVVGRLLRQVIVEKLANGNGIGAAGGDGALAGNVLEEADHHHLEIDDRVDARTARAALVVGGGAEPADLLGEAKGVEGVVELGVKGALGGPGQLLGGDPQLGLQRFSFGVKHSHSLLEHDLLSRLFVYFNRLLARNGIRDGTADLQ